jgi:multiple sugar transport system permease protein
VFLVVFSSIGFLRIFDQVYNMTSNDPGGPLELDQAAGADDLPDRLQSSYEMGYAAAQTVVLFLILLAVSIAQLCAC